MIVGCCQPETLLCELGAAVSLCRVQHLLTYQLPPRLVAGENTAVTDFVDTLVDHLSPLLTADQRSVRLTVYHLLTKLVPQLTQHSAETVKYRLVKIDDNLIVISYKVNY